MNNLNDSSSRSKMAAATTFSFGQNKPTGLGTTATPGFSFGAPTATPSVGSAFSASTPSTISFGAPKTNATSTGFSAFSGLTTSKPATLSGFGATSTASTGAFKFGSTAATTTASNVLSLSNLQTVNPGTSTSSLFGAAAPKATGSIFGNTTTAPASGLTLGGVPSTSRAFGGLATTNPGTLNTQTSITGLGGTGTSATVSLSGNVSGIAGKPSEIQNLKDNQVPTPIIQVVEEMKKYVKQQKDHRDEIARFSVSNIQKVQEETVVLRQSLAVVSNSIQRDACAVENLKMDVAQELKNAEIAQHTSEIPPALQHENMAPQEYFARLVESFEERMQIYRKQIEIMESHLASLSQGQALTPQDLSLVMHKVHNTFIALAAQLHGIHEAVKLQKEHYLNYRKAYFKDNTDIFLRNNRASTRPNIGTAIGPSPFSNIPTTGLNTTLGSKIQTTGLRTSGLGTTSNRLGMSTGFGSTLGGSGLLNTSFGTTPGTSGLGAGFKALGSQPAGATTGFGVAGQVNKPLGFGTPNTALGSTFGTPASSNTHGFGTLSRFELQKPPTGNKRGKKR